MHTSQGNIETELKILHIFFNSRLIPHGIKIFGRAVCLCFCTPDFDDLHLYNQVRFAVMYHF